MVNEAGFDVGHLGHSRLSEVLLAALPARGWEVEILGLSRPRSAFRLLVGGWPLLRRWDADLQQVRWHLVFGWLTRRAIMRRLAEGPEVDAILLHTQSVSFLLPRQEDVPVVLSADMGTRTFREYGLWRRPTVASRVAQRLTDAMEKRSIERHHATLAWSRWTRKTLPSDDNVVLWHPGIPRRAPSEVPKDPSRFLFVGGRFKDKGGYFLLQVLRPYLEKNEVCLDIVTKDEVDTDAPNVTVHRLDAGPALDQLFDRAGLMLLPSAGEGVPWVILEALRSGTPVMASDVGAIGELIEDDCGWVLDRQDSDAWRRSVDEHLARDEKAQQLVQDRCRARVAEHFDAESNTDLLDSILRTVIDSRDVAVDSGPHAARTSAVDS